MAAHGVLSHLSSNGRSLEDRLVAALSRLLDDADLRHRLGSQAFRDHKERFTFEAYMRRIHALWQTAAVATS